MDGLKKRAAETVTPVLDTEGNTNISGVTVVFRAGEQEQTPPEGFESSGSETVLGTEVKYDTPITRAITSANIDRLRFTFRRAGTGGNHLKGLTGIRRKSACWFRYSVNGGLGDGKRHHH
ncbi:putative phage tail component [Escherichia coli]|nr:putative phage tail component [Escherichia coli]